MTLDNPYWEYFQYLAPDWGESEFSRLYGRGLSEEAIRADVEASAQRHMYRHELVRLYSFAVPADFVIEKLAEYSPLVEMGAGTGYWAWLLKQAGADIIAFDRAPPPTTVEKNHYHGSAPGTWTTVWKGTPSVLGQHEDRTLLLCWPPMSSLAVRSLKAYPGKRVIYIGEGSGGCTADDAFFRQLRLHWNHVAEHSLPQWDGIHDYVEVWERK